MLDLDAFQAGGETGADQLHQEMQLDFPVLARLRAGDPEQPRRSAFDEIADDQHRSDAEMHPRGGVIALIAARLAGIAELRYSQRRQPRLHPSKAIQGLAAQLIPVSA